MTRIVTVFNQKGGSAKTMTTMQLAGTCALRGHKTLVIDMDSQGTSTIWSAIQRNPELRLPDFPADVRSMAPLGRAMVGPVGKLAPDYDLIVIDTPPATESEAPWAALQISDLGIIPFIPTADNQWARQAQTLAARAAAQNPDIRAVLHLPSCVRRGNVIETVLEQYKSDPKVAMMKTTIFQRNAYLEAQFVGLCVRQVSRSSAAAKEMEQLADEVLDLLDMPRTMQKDQKK
ncbi:MAG: ParA family protein [Sulfuritalea sp.]|nr:ParA family protein [Sulfuritalea sp.]